MKISIVLFALLGTSFLTAQNQEDEKAVIRTITSVVKAGDKNQVDELAHLLDERYRIVMNQLFGSEQLQIIPKEVYLAKIKSKEWGGDKRKVDIKQVMINGNTATALVQLTGSKMATQNLMHLVQNASGDWKLLEDTPIIL